MLELMLVGPRVMKSGSTRARPVEPRSRQERELALGSQKDNVGRLEGGGKVKMWMGDRVRRRQIV